MDRRTTPKLNAAMLGVTGNGRTTKWSGPLLFWKSPLESPETAVKVAIAAEVEGKQRDLTFKLGHRQEVASSF